MTLKNISRNFSDPFRGVTCHWFVVQTFRSILIEHEHSRITFRPRCISVSRRRHLPDTVECVRSPGPMCGSALFNDHRHNCIFIDLPSVLVCANDFIDANVANQITRDKDKITGDDPMRVNVTHRIPRRECFLGRHHGYDFEAARRMRPFGIPGSDVIGERRNDTRLSTHRIAVFTCSACERHMTNIS